MSRRINLLSISGGKDSTAMWLHALERRADFRCVFADTGHEHPDTYEYLDYLETQLGKSITRVRPDFTKRIAKKAEYVRKHWANKGVREEHIAEALELLKPTGNPFLDLCIWKGRFPSAKARFCTDELKTIPITEQVVLPILKSGIGVRSWQGVRAQESKRRATYSLHEQIDFGVWVYRPLIDWTHEEVFAIHRKHGIKPNPLYLKGMNRVGCMPCIMCRKSELAEISKRFPEVIERLKRWEELVSKVSPMGSSTFFNFSDWTPEYEYGSATYKTHGIEAAARWSRTERGGRQFNLFSEHEEIPSCSSNYGLCDLPELEAAQ